MNELTISTSKGNVLGPFPSSIRKKTLQRLCHSTCEKQPGMRIKLWSEWKLSTSPRNEEKFGRASFEIRGMDSK